MIAKYNDKYFCIDLFSNPYELWRYDYVEGFNRCKDEGLVFYNKYVELEEIDSIFEVGFSVCWDGQWCGINYSPKQEILTLITNNKPFAVAHNMYEFERGVFDCAMPASAFQEYRMWTKNLHETINNYTMVDYEEFKMLWKQMITDLLPPRE